MKDKLTRGWKALSRAWSGRSSAVKLSFVVGLFVAFTLGSYFLLRAESASFRVTVQHSFRSAKINLFMDDKLVLAGDLSITKKRISIFGHAQGNYSRTLHVPGGQHRVRVHIWEPSGTYNQTRENSVEFARDPQAQLQVICGAHGGMALNWDNLPEPSQEHAGTPAAAKASASSLPKYLVSVLLSLMWTAGSAVIGFYIQEYIRSRRRSQA
ncbi:MAG TPA: hypothetical protein VK473_04650 [Terriglobales bacterium]|nr:hypothetical protein [Terriglobales bacterium]